MTGCLVRGPAVAGPSGEFHVAAGAGAPRLAVRAAQSACAGVLPGCARYGAVLGGSLCYGAGVARPFPALLQARLQMPVLNLGCRNAGVEAAMRDPAVLGLAAGACHVVVQITGAQAVSNRFYRVHPRRNDRLIGPSDALRRLYPEVDFTAFAFTGHLLGALARLDADGARFALVVAELRSAWSARMASLLAELDGGGLTLLHVVTGRGDAEGQSRQHGQSGQGGQASARPGDGLPLAEPAFVTAAMVRAVAPAHARIVTLAAGHAARLPGAQSLLHQRLATALEPHLAESSAGQGGPRGGGDTRHAPAGARRQ